jgi:LPPG:FO 2-phospho-L-lactate transferase
VKVVVLAGGIGGARFLLGVKAALGLPSEHEITAVVNTGDDIWLHGLRICPDLDTCMYTLGGGIDTERGWGRAGETWVVTTELARYGADPDWFGLGDRDLATHLVRTRMLRAGYPLSVVTAALCDRWRPGVRLLPATDDRCETHVVVTDTRDGQESRDGQEPQGRRAMHFQEWWIRYRAALPASMLPMDTTGLDGASSTASAPAIASRTPAAGSASSAPTGTNSLAGSAARYRIHHSWKCIARRPCGS